MKKNKKGFTIVELVIVIAVIGILAAVLIPTFSGVINNAHKTAAQEEGRNAIVAYMGENLGSLENFPGTEDAAKWNVYEADSKVVGYGYKGNGYIAIFSADGNYIATVTTAEGNDAEQLVKVSVDGKTPFTGWSLKTATEQTPGTTD